MDEQLEQARSRDLDRAVRDARVLVTTGAGGVGKTTSAAALGLAGAAAGRDCLVITIDPAERLAQAMGLESLDDAPREVEVSGPGRLDAMMLDMQSTFDELIDRHAGSRSKAEAIRENRIYRTLSSTLSGTQEYMAMEKLHELHEAGRWDLLIVDTPPTRNALDFLEAPKRMTSFLEGRLLKTLLHPGLAAGRRSVRLFNFGATAFMRMAGRVTGMGLLEDLATFFRHFEGMYEGFKQRAGEVLSLLQHPDSRFVVVTSPQPPPLREARFFIERLQQEGLHLAGVAVNRIHPRVDAPDDRTLRAAAGEQADDTTGRAAAGALRLLADIRNLGDRERRAVGAALYGLHPEVLCEVPLLASDVHDLDGLATIAGALVGSRPQAGARG